MKTGAMCVIVHLMSDMALRQISRRSRPVSRRRLAARHLAKSQSEIEIVGALTRPAAMNARLWFATP